LQPTHPRETVQVSPYTASVVISTNTCD